MGVTEICKECFYIKQILEFLGKTIQYPIEINVDNQGEIWIENNGEGKRSKHIYTRKHFIRE